MRFSVNEQSFVSNERIGVLEKFVAQEKIGLQILQDVYLRSVYLDIRPVKLPLKSLNTTTVSAVLPFTNSSDSRCLGSVSIRYPLSWAYRKDIRHMSEPVSGNASID